MTYRIDDDDIKAAEAALRAATKDLEAAADKGLRTGAAKVTRDAQSRLRSRAGGGTYPRRAAMIATTRNPPGVKLVGSRFPWALGAEYGARHAWVFGRKVLATSISRRQFPSYGGNTFSISGSSGYLVAPAIRANADEVAQGAADEIDDEYRTEFRRRGLKVR